MPASSPTAASTDATFDALRPRLFAIAYRMLGTRADAEDVLQDAWLRWHQTDPTALQSAEAWLVTVVTPRMTSSRLKSVDSMSSLPASILEKSRMSLMMPSSELPAV